MISASLFCDETIACVTASESFLRISSLAAIASLSAEAISLAKDASAVNVELIGWKTVLVSYNPIIRAQGSFMLGTMIRPLNEQDDLDIDLVCELTGKGASWTQYDLKHKVGNRLKDHETYKRMLDE